MNELFLLLQSYTTWGLFRLNLINKLLLNNEILRTKTKNGIPFKMLNMGRIQ
jgi:hypothetical protein